MDLRGHLVKKVDKYYIIEDVSLSGILLAKNIDDISSKKYKNVNLDPLKTKLAVSESKLVSQGIISSMEVSIVLNLCSVITKRPVKMTTMYKLGKGRFLLVFQLLEKKKLLLYIDNYTIYRMKAKYSLGKSDEIEFSDYDYIRVSHYNSNKELVHCLEKLSFGVSLNVPIKLRILSQCTEVKDNEFIIIGSEKEGYYSVISNSYLQNEVRNRVTYKLSRSVLSKCISSIYDFACPHFSNEELVKLNYILSNYGYEYLMKDIVRFNGKRSNFKTINDDEYICILDRIGHGYDVGKICIAEIRDSNRNILYYEVRLFPLCENGTFSVLYSSVRKEDCKKVVNYKIASLIRGSRVSLVKHPFEVLRVQDNTMSINVEYCKKSKNIVYSAVYMKEEEKWVFNNKCSGKDIYFLNALLRTLLKDCKEYKSIKYILYDASEKAVIDSNKSLGTYEDFSECRSFADSNTSISKCLIVRYVEDVKSDIWLLNKGRNLLDKIL